MQGRTSGTARERGSRLQNDQKSIEASAKLECLDHAAAVMLHLGDMLTSNEKIRVTIERDPETERFTMKREVIT